MLRSERIQMLILLLKHTQIPWHQGHIGQKDITRGTKRMILYIR